MRLLLTGGTGLVGSAVSAALLERGTELIVLSRNPPPPGRALRGVKYARWDGHSSAGWATLLEGATALIHLSGEPLIGKFPWAFRWTATQRRRILESRIATGQALCEAVQRARYRPRILLQASAVGYYGSRVTDPSDESAPKGQGFLAETCAQWEASTQAMETLGVRRAILRLGVVLDRSRGALPRQALPFRFFVGGRLGDGRQPFPWVHLQDVVGALLFLLEHPAAQGVYNLVAPQTLDNASFAVLLGKALRRPALLPAPAWALKLLFGEAAQVLLEGQRAIPRRLLEAGYPFRFPTAEGALLDLLRGTKG